VPIPTGAIDVTTRAALDDTAKALTRVADLSVDVEADAMHHFRARLCFVQLGTDTDIFLLDTLEPEVDVKALAPVFGDALVTKFFHAAGGDLTWLAEAGVRVKGLFDTHRAATLLGWPKVGLADLVLEKLGVALDKAHQQSDFSLRPLPEGMRAYIADDVRYLTDVGRQVRDACMDAEILEEVLLDCERMCDEAAEHPDVSVAYKLKLPKGGLSAKQVRLAEALGQRLHQLRLQWAEKADVPMGRMLSNAAIGSIATKLPSAVKELARLEGVRGAFVREHGDEVLELVAQLRAAADRDELPPGPEKPERDPRRRKREDALTSWRKDTAAKRKVTPSVVLPNALVADLAANPPANAGELEAVRYIGKRRLTLHGDDILKVLAPLR